MRKDSSMRAQMAIDQKLAELRKTDPVGAAAFAMRHKGTCPACGRYAIKATAENAVSGMRSFFCTACQWTATVTEAEYRGNPIIVFRAICEEAKRAASMMARPRISPKPYTPPAKPEVERQVRTMPKDVPQKPTKKDAKGGDERNDGRDKPTGM